VKAGTTFRSGTRQTVRMPKKFQIEADGVEIVKRRTSLLLRPKGKSWQAFFESLEKFTDDFMKSGRKQPRVQRSR
jgi:antitoxin VapB